jgi:hypothetical protein
MSDEINAEKQIMIFCANKRKIIFNQKSSLMFEIDL